MYASFREFYPFYLGEHADRRCRRLHFLGSWLVIASVVIAIATRNPWWLIAAPVGGYGCAWIGHFVFEKNKPATFRHPVYTSWVTGRCSRTSCAAGCGSELPALIVIIIGA